jgi:hypothetical protein
LITRSLIQRSDRNTLAIQFMDSFTRSSFLILFLSAFLLGILTPPFPFGYALCVQRSYNVPTRWLLMSNRRPKTHYSCRECDVIPHELLADSYRVRTSDPLQVTCLRCLYFLTRQTRPCYTCGESAPVRYPVDRLLLVGK